MWKHLHAEQRVVTDFNVFWYWNIRDLLFIFILFCFVFAFLWVVLSADLLPLTSYHGAQTLHHQTPPQHPVSLHAGLLILQPTGHCTAQAPSEALGSCAPPLPPSAIIPQLDTVLTRSNMPPHLPPPPQLTSCDSVSVLCMFFTLYKM